MKTYFVLAVILAAGMAVYPQATRSARETNENKSERSSVKRESVRQSTGKTDVNTGNERKETTARTDPRPDIKPRTFSGNNSATRIARSVDPGEVRINPPFANRVFREDKGTLIRDDGTVIRHQNDEIFTRGDYKVDYDNHDVFRRSEEFRRAYADYYYWYDSRVIRYTSHYPRYRPIPAHVRRERFVYRQPSQYDLIWTPYLFNRFMYFYPANNYWNIEYGRELETISAYDVMNSVGTVRRVYGKVEEVFFSREDYNYILYIGAPFPYQDMSIVIPRVVIRRLTRNPEWYFKNQHIWVIGLIELWEEKPEIVVRDEEQIRRY